MARKTVILTGLIGSGKSAVAALLRERGVPVYDSDARTKRLYERSPALVDALEEALGESLRDASQRLDRRRLAAHIFSNAWERERVEALVYPFVLRDFKRWRARRTGAPFVVLESAVILSKPLFDGLADAVVLVTAPEALRLERVMRRDGISEEAARARMAAQHIPEEKVTVTLSNDGTPEALSSAVTALFFDKNSYLCKISKQTLKHNPMKTDLAKTLSIRGQHGLFNYIAQSRSGAIVEALEDKKRYNFAANAGITTLADISIYTSEGEMKLQEVFGKMHEVLKEADAPGAKSSDKELKDLFAKALPNYDADRFYVSHMKKVVEWYNCLKKFASLDFLTDEEREAEAPKEA